MPSLPEELRVKVTNIIQVANSPNYDILSNLEAPKYSIGSLFPDLIFIDKTTKAPTIIIEVKRNGSIAQCLQAWKAAPTIPATLYIVVPENELATSKSIAQVVGLQPKFGTYKEENEQIKIIYE